MDTRRRFHEIIRQHPDDDAPRLIYADWLDELGDPRGEFIRVQCELAKLPGRERTRRDLLEQREQSLLRSFREKWIRSLATFHFEIREEQFHRGFLEEVRLIYWQHPGDVPSQFASRWKKLIEQEPALQRIRLSLYRDWDEINPVDFVPQLRALHINHQGLARREVSRILRWPIVRGLSTLDLSHNNLRSGVECVAHPPSLNKLQELDLSFNQIGTRGARALAASSCLQGLQSLNLRGNHIGRFGKQKLREAFGPRVQL